MGEKNLHIVVSEQLHQRVKIAAAMNNKDMKKYVSEILLDAVNREGH